MSVDPAQLSHELRAALIARAKQLDVDPDTVRSPSPGALVARQHGGDVLRLDFHTYSASELRR